MHTYERINGLDFVVVQGRSIYAVRRAAQAAALYVRDGRRCPPVYILPSWSDAISSTYHVITGVETLRMEYHGPRALHAGADYGLLMIRWDGTPRNGPVKQWLARHYEHVRDLRRAGPKVR